MDRILGTREDQDQDQDHKQPRRSYLIRSLMYVVTEGFGGGGGRFFGCGWMTGYFEMVAVVVVVVVVGGGGVGGGVIVAKVATVVVGAEPPTSVGLECMDDMDTGRSHGPSLALEAPAVVVP